MKTHTPESKERRLAAQALIDSGCVSVRTDEPFRLPSGWASPVYMDCRRLISYPAARKALLAQGQALLRQAGALDGVDSVAGGESSGIALAAWLSDALDVPMQYVRKRAAGHRVIEGVIPENGQVLLVDDMMAVGQSKVRFRHALSDVGARVESIFVFFAYDTFPVAAELEASDVNVYALATWQDVLEVARELGEFPDRAIAELEGFLQDPVGWSQIHGGLNPGHAARSLT